MSSSAYGVFEQAAAGDSEQKRQQRIAADKMAAAIYDVKDQFGSFLSGAEDVQDFRHRVALVRDDMIKTVEPHLFPRTGVMRRICKQLEREFTAADKGDALIPEGDFHAYKDKVDDNAESKMDKIWVETENTEHHTGDPAKTLFAKTKKAAEGEVDAGASASGSIDVAPDVYVPGEALQSTVDHFAAWCRTAKVTPSLDTLDRYAATYQAPDEVYIALVSALQHTASRIEASRRTAAPDYLTKADEALTNLLNQRAEEFQQTIEPLQQALMVVQQAEAEQQAANPMNVMPGGQINVMPPGTGAPAGGGDPMGGGMPPGGGGDPMADPAMAAMMGGGDPAMGGGAPPMDPAMGGDPMAGGGGDIPPEMMQQLMMQGKKAAPKKGEARKGRSAITAADVVQKFEDWSKKRVDQQGTLPTGTEADVDQFTQENQVGQRALKKLKQHLVGNIENGTSDDFYAPAAGYEYEDPYQQNGWKMTRATEDGSAEWQHPSGYSLAGRDGPDGGSWQLYDAKGPFGKPFTDPGDAQDAILKRLGKTSGFNYGPDDFRQDSHWSNEKPFYSPNDGDYDIEFARRREDNPLSGLSELERLMRPSYQNGLEPNHPHAAYGDYARQIYPEHFGKQGSRNRKQAWMGFGSEQPGAHRVAGWEWDGYLNAHVASKPREFTCSCGKPFAAPSGFQRCACGKQWNSYVIGTGGDRHEASAEKYLVREIPTRDNVIVAAKTADCEGDKDKGDDDCDEDKNEDCPPWEKDASRDFARFVAEAFTARESALTKLTDPGEITDTEDSGTPEMKQPPEDWARRNPDGKWNKGPRRSI